MVILFGRRRGNVERWNRLCIKPQSLDLLLFPGRSQVVDFLYCLMDEMSLDGFYFIFQ
jgi:hypothetical protein